MVEYLRLVRLYAAALAAGALLVLSVLTIRPEAISPAVTAGLAAAAAVLVVSRRRTSGEEEAGPATPAAAIVATGRDQPVVASSRARARNLFAVLNERERVIELRLAIARGESPGTAVAAEV